MSLRRKAWLLAFVAVVLSGAAWWWFLCGRETVVNPALAELQRTRLALRQRGFRLALAEFALTNSPAAAARAALLDQAGAAAYSRLAEEIDFLPPVGPDAALVMWSQPRLGSESSLDLWADLQSQLNESALTEGCAAALSGPYRSRSQQRPDGSIGMLGGNADRLAEPLAAHLLLLLHQGEREKAWTNLLALTSLLANWQPQPFEPNLLYWRNTSLVRTFGATWQALQAGGWTESQLATLQALWEGADFRHGLCERAAFARTETEAACHRLGQRPLPRLSWSLLFFPREAWQQHTQRVAVLRYRNTERFQDETVLLRLFSDCEENYRVVEAAATWQELRANPRLHRQSAEATALATLATKFNLQSERWRLLSGVYSSYLFAFEPCMQGQLWRLADSETMRRLLVVALALERYHLRYGAYPNSLDALPPELLPNPMPDFMDGQPLRYRRTHDGHFVLYSIGRDLQDDGGTSRTPALLWANSGEPHTDLVWPRPATREEVQAEFSKRRQLGPAARRTFIREQ